MAVAVRFLVLRLFMDFCDDRKVEGSRETARLTAELLRAVISAQKLPSPTNQAAALIAVVRGVGQRLIAANPVGMPFCFGHTLLVVLHSCVINVLGFYRINRLAIKTLHVIVIVYHTRLLINKMSPFAIGNIVRHIFHIIREEELSLCLYPLKAGIEIVMREMINHSYVCRYFSKASELPFIG